MSFWFWLLWVLVGTALAHIVVYVPYLLWRRWR